MTMAQRTWTIVDDAATNAYNALDEYCAEGFRFYQQAKARKSRRTRKN